MKLFMLPKEMQEKVKKGKELLKQQTPPALQSKVNNQDVLREYAKHIDPTEIFKREEQKKLASGIMKSKRGMTEIIFILTEVLIAAILLVASYMVWVNWQDAWTEHGMNSTYEQRKVIADTNAMFVPADYLILALMIALYIGMLISSMYVKTHQVFIILFWVFTIFAVILSVFISNIWEVFIADPGVAPYASPFERTNWLFARLPFITFGMIVGGIIIMYSKFKAPVV